MMHRAFQLFFWTPGFSDFFKLDYHQVHIPSTTAFLGQTRGTYLSIGCCHLTIDMAYCGVSIFAHFSGAFHF